MGSQERDPAAEARTRFLERFPEGPWETEVIPLRQTLGRILAEDLHAKVDLPPYPRVIVEGYLLDPADGAGAGEQGPVELRVEGKILPGDEDLAPLTPGTAMEVSTGSPIPSSGLAVVRATDVDRKGNTIRVKRPVQAGANIEEQGCDLRRGQLLIPKGKRIGPEEIGLLASQGILEARVAAPPRVSIFSSGNEVIPPSEPLRRGAIWDSNSYALIALVTEAGGEPKFEGIMPDDFDRFLKRLKEALPRCEMLLISGGTAVGGRDFIADLVGALGPPGVIVNGVPMRSGKPLVMGVAGNKPVVCVAGHPPEAIRGFRLFGGPAIERLLGRHDAG